MLLTWWPAPFVFSSMYGSFIRWNYRWHTLKPHETDLDFSAHNNPCLKDINTFPNEDVGNMSIANKIQSEALKSIQKVQTDVK